MTRSGATFADAAAEYLRCCGAVRQHLLKTEDWAFEALHKAGVIDRTQYVNTTSRRVSPAPVLGGIWREMPSDWPSGACDYTPSAMPGSHLDPVGSRDQGSMPDEGSTSHGLPPPENSRSTAEGLTEVAEPLLRLANAGVDALSGRTCFALEARIVGACP